MSASGETDEILQLLATDKTTGRPAGHHDLRRSLLTLGSRPTTLDAGAGGRRGAGLLGRQRSLLVRTGAYGVDHNHARAGRCAGGCAIGKARIQRKRTSRTSIPAESWASGSLGCRRSCTAAKRCPAVAPSTPIGQVIYEMSRKGLGMTTVVERRQVGRSHQRRRLAAPAGAPWQRGVRPHRQPVHDSAAENN